MKQTAKKYAELFVSISLFAHPAVAGTQMWIDPRGGLFSDQSNWSTAVPQSFDTAQFDLNSTFVVTFDQDFINSNLNVRRGDVTLDLGGFTYSFTPAAGDHIRVAEVIGQFGTLRLNHGTLSDTGARVGVGGTGTLIIDGADSHLTLTNTVNAGYTSTGTINVLNGATLSAATGLVGLTTNGFATVSGKGSTWTNTSFLNVGGPSTSFAASLDVRDGGMVISPSTDVLRSGRITGNSTLQTNLDVQGGSIWPGGAMQTETLTIDGNFTMLSDVVSNVSIELAGTAPDSSGSGFDALVITGAATLNYKLNVSLINGFSPPRGWTFAILSSSARTGTFSQVVLPPLPNGGTFTVVYTATGVQLVTPGQLGDATGDDQIDVDDLLAVINAWGSCAPLGAGCTGDVNGDGDIDVDDLLLVINHWG